MKKIRRATATRIVICGSMMISGAYLNYEYGNRKREKAFTLGGRALLEGVGIKMGGNGLCAECYAKDQAKRWHQ